MRITRSTVEEVSAEVETLTEGHFRMASCRMHPSGDGRWEYIDSGTGLRWIGADGAREACAYYIGAALGYIHAAGQMIPERATWLRAVQDAYGMHARYRNWEEVGRMIVRSLVNEGTHPGSPS